MKKLISKIVPTLFLAVPVVASAQLNGVRGLVEATGEIVEIATIVVAGIALLAFFWGLAQYIFKLGGDEKAVESGKTLMKWGTVALFVMISIWGIVRFIQDEILSGYDVTSPVVLPTF